jgi:hypothetical protein
MQCEHVTELLLADEEGGRTPEARQHLASCARCAHVAQGVGRLNAVLQSVLVSEPPLELQRQLAALVATEAVPAPRRAAWWSRLFGGNFNLGELVAVRPNVIAAQGLAAVMLALASWQIFGWLSTFQPFVGDVGYAVQLVASSPAPAYLGGLQQIDFQSLGVWSVVGLAAWLVSDTGPIGRRLPGLRLP